jgi:exopolysaccharide biosynthesis polyprenyl glycosylphosphotransferase
MLNEEISHLSLDAGFGLPLDAGLDLSSLRPVAAHGGRFIVRAALPVADAMALFAASLVAVSPNAIAFGFALVTLTSLLAAGKHEARIDLRLSRDIPSLAAFVAIGLAAALVLAPATSTAHSLVRLGAVALVTLVIARVLAYGAIRGVRSHQLAMERTLIVGAGPLSTQLATSLGDHPEFGLRPIGFLDARRVVSGASMAVLGDYSSLERVVRQFKVQHVIIGFGRSLDLVQTVRACQALAVRTHLIARGGDLGIIPDGRHVDDVMGISLVRVRRAALSCTNRIRIKRALDVTAGFSLLVLTAPVFVAVATAVRLSSPGPALFRQRRIGLGGKPFDLLKFRSMRVNSDSDTTWSVAHDRRVTPIGRILRKTSIDELPQLFNVLRGDMSLIGPRPERPHFVEQFGSEVPHYQDRHRAPVGITGWAQVHKLRGDTSIAERVRMDNYYIEHWTPWLDLVIALRTLGEVLRGV